MPAETAVPWRTPTRLAFRFCVLYFGLYVLCTQMAGAIFLPPVGRSVEVIVPFVGAHVFHVTPTRAVTGSGDTLFDWIETFTLLLLAIAGTVVWTVLDRRRPAYPRLNRWFRICLRFALAGTMITYGMMKAVPLQMPAPSLSRLIEPFGQFSPMGVLWSSIGASFPYERFTGSVELTTGILLCLPRTATLGALLALAATTQVFVLNMTYDVPVKLLSFHLVLMSAFLLAPEGRRLASIFLAAGARSRWSAAAQTAFGVLLVATGWHGAMTARRQFSGMPKSPLYGIWRVDGGGPDDRVSAPLPGADLVHSRDVVIDSPGLIAFVRVDAGTVDLPAVYDVARRTFDLTAGGRPFGSLEVQQPDAEHLTFDGSIGGRAIHLETTRVELAAFPLLGPRFHWIQEYPVNRQGLLSTPRHSKPTDGDTGSRPNSPKRSASRA